MHSATVTRGRVAFKVSLHCDMALSSIVLYGIDRSTLRDVAFVELYRIDSSHVNCLAYVTETADAWPNLSGMDSFVILPLITM